MKGRPVKDGDLPACRWRGSGTRRSLNERPSRKGRRPGWGELELGELVPSMKGRPVKDGDSANFSPTALASSPPQ